MDGRSASTAFLLVFTTLFFAPAQAQTPEQPFGMWVEEFKKTAIAEGISEATVNEAMNNAEFIDRVIELDRKQPEGTLTLEQYLKNVVNAKRIKKGREMTRQHRSLLKKIGHEYNVQPQFIAALWGVETNYGSNTGGYSLVSSLATLAYEGRRADFFRDELIKVLRISESDHIPPGDIKGSWAGAMGQCQFMPSSFLNFAVDHNKDGKRDIWHTQQDVFASIANYLKQSGWNDKEGWGREVKLPEDFDMALADIKTAKPMSEWKKLGVHRSNGKPLPAGDTPMSLAMVGEGEDAVPYLVTGNYKVLLKWNRSRFFATAVGQLSDRIK